VPELGSLGSVRGALGNERPYREQHTMDAGISLETQNAVRVAPFKLIRGQPSVA